MQVVSRGTIDEAVEEFARLRSDCSIVPCGTIASFGTRFCRSADKEAKGSATLVWGREAVPIKVGRFVPRGTQTASFRVNLGASDPRERDVAGKEGKKTVIF